MNINYIYVIAGIVIGSILAIVRIKRQKRKQSTR